MSRQFRKKIVPCLLAVVLLSGLSPWQENEVASGKNDIYAKPVMIFGSWLKPSNISEIEVSKQDGLEKFNEANSAYPNIPKPQPYIFEKQITDLATSTATSTIGSDSLSATSTISTTTLSTSTTNTATTTLIDFIDGPATATMPLDVGSSTQPVPIFSTSTLQQTTSTINTGTSTSATSSTTTTKTTAIPTSSTPALPSVTVLPTSTLSSTSTILSPIASSSILTSTTTISTTTLLATTTTVFATNTVASTTTISTTTTMIATTTMISTTTFMTGTTTIATSTTSTTKTKKEKEEPVDTDVWTDGSTDLIISGFNIAKSPYTMRLVDRIKEPKLGVSLATLKYENIKDDTLIISYSTDSADGWKKLRSINLKKDHSNLTRNGYLYLPLNHIKTVGDLKETKIKFEYQYLIRPDKIEEGKNWEKQAKTIYIDSTWIEAKAYERPEDMSLLLVSGKDSFALDENIEMEFAYFQRNNSIINNLSGKMSSYWQKVNKKGAKSNEDNSAGSDNSTGSKDKKDDFKLQAMILDKNGKFMTTLEPEIIYKNGNRFKVRLNKSQRKFRPGNYTLEVGIIEGDKLISYSQDFTWGVLAINTNRSIYTPGEQAYLQMAALNDSGHTICDAELSLLIIKPDNSSQNLQVMRSQECGPDNVVSVPDYYSYFSDTAQLGIYKMVLQNMENSYSITDYFEVKDNPAFEVERIGPTRIYPPAQYSMELKIKVNKDLKGKIVERFPSDFVVSNWSLRNYFGEEFEMKLEQGSHVSSLTSLVEWDAGEEYILSYYFDAPHISPYIYLMGPMELFKGDWQNRNVLKTEQVIDLMKFSVPATDAPTTTATTTPVVVQKPKILVQKQVPATQFDSIFIESRQWQIASDEMEYIDPNGDGTLTQCLPTPSGVDHYTILDDLFRYPDEGGYSDYLICALNEVTILEMTTITDVTSVSSITVWLFGHVGLNVVTNIELWDADESTQYGNTVQIPYTGQTDKWVSATFDSLSLTQSQLDGLKIRYEYTAPKKEESVPATTYAEVTYEYASSSVPIVSDVSLNSQNNITLIEDSTVLVSATGTVSHGDGYEFIDNVTAKIFRSGVSGAEACEVDDNNCYEIQSCGLSDCSVNSCLATCSIQMQFHADPTSVSTTFSAQYWRAWIEATDTSEMTGEAYSPIDAPEVDGLTAIQAEQDVYFSQSLPGGITDPLDRIVTVTSTGNVSLDLNIYSDDLTSPSTTAIIPPSNIRFSLVTNTAFASATALGYSPGQSVDINIPKNISSSSLQTGQIWFGLEVPVPAKGIYAGTFYFNGFVNSLPWP
ncbi:MAG: hypothetical protein ABH832_02770 [bacterium]